MLTGPIPATAQGARARRPDHRPDRRVEVNEAFASVPLAWNAEFRDRPGAAQPARRRDRARPPARRVRRPADDHADQPPRADRRPLRPADDVRGRRHGERDHHRVPRVGTTAQRETEPWTSPTARRSSPAAPPASAWRPPRRSSPRGVHVTIVDLPVLGRRGRRRASSATLAAFAARRRPRHRRGRPRRSTSPSRAAPLRALVHCAGRGGTVRAGQPGRHPRRRRALPRDRATST